MDNLQCPELESMYTEFGSMLFRLGSHKYFAASCAVCMGAASLCQAAMHEVWDQIVIMISWRAFMQYCCQP